MCTVLVFRLFYNLSSAHETLLCGMTLLLQTIEANYLLGTKIVWSGITSTSRCMH